MCVLLCLPIGSNKMPDALHPRGSSTFLTKNKCHRQTYKNTRVLFFGSYWSEFFFCARLTLENSGLNAVKRT